MADFVKPTTAIHKASVLEGHDLLFVHCVSSEPTLLVSMGYRVFSFECREIHISFLDSLHTCIRRIAILIFVYLSLKVDEIFADCNSPALIEIHSSCAFRVSRLLNR
jgi:hypothetical protein